VYRKFLQDQGYTHLLSDPERLIYAEVREINGVKLGIGGFNSAWNSNRDCEKSKLWLGGDWQNGTIVKILKSKNADLKLALIRHSPGWFVEQEDSKRQKQMERDFDFFVRLNLETDDVEIWLRKYEDNGGGWIPRIIKKKTTNDGL
jgi:hypothetical protein